MYLIISPVKKLGGSGSQFKNRKNWWKFENLEKFTCIRYWSTNSVNFKNRSKSENFWHFWRFLPITKPLTKLFLFFWYTVDPWEHVGTFSKTIQVKNFLIKIVVSPLGISHPEVNIGAINVLLKWWSNMQRIDYDFRG